MKALGQFYDGVVRFHTAMLEHIKDFIWSRPWVWVVWAMVNVLLIALLFTQNR